MLSLKALKHGRVFLLVELKVPSCVPAFKLKEVTDNILQCGDGFTGVGFVKTY